jgi:hypothetical protein
VRISGTGAMMEDTSDWEIDANGLYVATRSFLIRRGYCCGNQCRHCPYVNWRHSSSWQPLPAESIHSTHVSLMVLEGIRKALSYHEEQLEHEPQSAQAYHQTMLKHYRLLLERWAASYKEQ